MIDHVVVDSRTVAYTAAGQGRGQTIVFLHLFGGSSNVWSEVVRRLAPDRRCIAMDVPGFGDSDPPSPGSTVSTQAETLHRALDELGVDERVLVGHSMGGKLALAMATRATSKLERLVLVATSPAEPESRSDAERRRMSEAHGDRQAMKDLVDGLPDSPLVPSAREALVNDHLRASREGWNWWLGDGAPEDLGRLPSAVAVPTLVVSGDRDPVFDPESHRRLSLRLPLGRHASIADAGHLIPLEAPEELASLIRAHL